MSNQTAPAVEQRDNFNSQFGTMMSMAGLAIGLGNCWRFPYLCAQWGGGPFLFVYMLVVIFIVIPFLIVEIGMGKGHGKGVADCYEASWHNRPFSMIFGNFFAAENWAQNFFVVGIGATIAYLFYSAVTTRWDTVPADKIYGEFKSMPVLQIILFLCIVALIGFVAFKGVSKGIEKVSSIAIPMMLIIFIVVFILVCATTPNITKGLNYYLNPDFSKMKNPQLWSDAIVQALFSTGAGPGPVLVYGSHIGKHRESTMLGISLGLMDTCAGILAGLAIIPACVAMGIDPQSGSNLIFLVLPTICSRIPLGALIGVLMFFGIFCAAVTTMISNQECAITTFSDSLKCMRKKVIPFVIICTICFGTLDILNVKADAFFQYMAGDLTFLPGAMMGSITYVYAFGVKKIRTQFLNPYAKVKLGRWFDRWVQFIVVPVFIFFCARSFIMLFLG
ncbi:MAG: sodium-dependent transporter [Anaerovoracaceae bacterium]|jgi:NSS family neurotransmitter:Na+ symporter